jgi:hypothetical protein
MKDMTTRDMITMGMKTREMRNRNASLADIRYFPLKIISILQGAFKIAV